MTFFTRKEADGFRVISEAKSGEEWDVDGPFSTQEEADKALEFHQAEWKQSHTDGEE
jgi:dsDNA-binding SOS-regulon protein